jgi:hypothetical protein
MTVCTLAARMQGPAVCPVRTDFSLVSNGLKSVAPNFIVCWHGIWPDGLCGFRPNAAGMRPVAYSPHGPPPAPMPRSRASPGSDARHRSPDVILGFAEYALFFPIYICLSFSLFAL